MIARFLDWLDALLHPAPEPLPLPLNDVHAEAFQRRLDSLRRAGDDAQAG